MISIGYGRQIAIFVKIALLNRNIITVYNIAPIGKKQSSVTLGFLNPSNY